MMRVWGAIMVAVLVGCGDGKSAKPDAGKDAPVEAILDLRGSDRGDVGAEAAAGAAGTDAAGEVAEGTDGGAGDAATDGAGDVVGTEAGDASVAEVDAAGADGSSGDVGAVDGASGDAADGGEVAEPRTVKVMFTGTVVTVAGAPLGFDSTVRTKPVTGTFSYDLGYVDDTPAADRGKFERFGKMAFSFVVDGHTLAGSGKGILQTENLVSSDTFRYYDGPQGDAAVRTMKMDGVEQPKLKLLIAISDGTATMLTSDALPAPFPTLDIKTTPHTFSLMDDGGTLLMQLDTLVNQ